MHPNSSQPSSVWLCLCGQCSWVISLQPYSDKDCSYFTSMEIDIEPDVLSELQEVVCCSNILQQSTEALVNSRFPVLQINSKISFSPQLKHYIITSSLLFILLIPSGQTNVAVNQAISRALLSIHDLGRSLLLLQSICKGTLCGSDEKPWGAGQNVPKIKHDSPDSYSSALHNTKCRWKVSLGKNMAC